MTHRLAAAESVGHIKVNSGVHGAAPHCAKEDDELLAKCLTGKPCSDHARTDLTNIYKHTQHSLHCLKLLPCLSISEPTGDAVH